MRKIKPVLTSVFLVLSMLFSGCTNSAAENESTGALEDTVSYIGMVASNLAEILNESSTPTAMAREMGTAVLECFNTKDKETLKNLFSENILSEYSDEIDYKIDIAFDAFDGKIVSHGDINGSGLGSIETRTFECIISQIMTDTGTEYYLDIQGYYRHDDDPCDVGIASVILWNVTTKKEIASTDELTTENSYLYSYSISHH